VKQRAGRIALRRIALSGAAVLRTSAKAHALIGTGFVRMQGGDIVGLTDAGLARARELRFGRPRHR
jgi:hypothetical protein